MKKNILKKLLLISLVIGISSCSRAISKIFPERADSEFGEDLKEASPEFRMGWEDGCESGMSAGANRFYKAFYDNNKVDGYQMANSSDYKTAWSNSFWWCYRRTYIKQKSSIWGSMFSGHI